MSETARATDAVWSVRQAAGNIAACSPGIHRWFLDSRLCACGEPQKLVARNGRLDSLTSDIPGGEMVGTASRKPWPLGPANVRGASTSPLSRDRRGLGAASE